MKAFRILFFGSALAFLFLSVANAQHVVKAFEQKHFPTTVPAGNYSGITHLHDDVYAVVSDKSDSSLYFNFRIQLDSLTGDLRHVECLGGVGHVDTCGLDHEAIAKVSDSTLVIASEGLFRFTEYSIEHPTHGLWTMRKPTADFYPNYGYESLTYDSVRHCLWSITESTLRKDGKPASWQNGESNRLRLFAFDKTGTRASYAYQMDAPSTNKAAQMYVMGVSELCALPDGQLLVLEREAWIPKIKIGAFCRCKLYLVNPSQEKVFAMTDAFSSDTPFVRKRLLTEWTTKLSLLGRSFANYEGMCLGPRLANGDWVLILLADSQNQYAGVLRDWFKTIVISPSN